MQPVKRIVDDCPICENRGLVCVGIADEAVFPGPHWNYCCLDALKQLSRWLLDHNPSSAGAKTDGYQR